MLGLCFGAVETREILVAQAGFALGFEQAWNTWLCSEGEIVRILSGQRLCGRMMGKVGVVLHCYMVAPARCGTRISHVVRSGAVLADTRRGLCLATLGHSSAITDSNGWPAIRADRNRSRNLLIPLVSHLECTNASNGQ